MFQKYKNVNDEWFYSKPNWLLRQLHVYVKGDSFVILTIWIFILLTGVLSWKFMLIEIGLFLFLRGLGEMIYWLFQQFGDKKYRPESSQKELSNNAVYILYQLSGLRNAFIGLTIVIAVILYLY